MKTILASWMGTLVVGLTTAGLAACGAPDVGDDGVQNEDEIVGGDSLTSAAVVSDFGNLVELKGRVGMYEGSTDIALFNRSQPEKRGILHHVGGGQMGFSDFETQVDIGNYLVPGDMIASPGDCISVANVGTGGRAHGPTLEEAKAKKEFGAFLYVTTSLRDGSPNPAWAVEGAKVYASVAECLADPIRE